MKKTIELLRDLNFYQVHLANSVRPTPPAPPIGSPPTESKTLDNSVHYSARMRLEVEHDEEWEQFEPHEGETWFKNAEHPAGFRVPNADFRYIDPAKD